MIDATSVRFLVAALAGWLDHRQQEVVGYLVEENRTLRAQLGGRRLRLTDDQRRRLAVRGQRLGRARLRQVATIVTPDTILRWHRQLRDLISARSPTDTMIRRTVTGVGSATVVMSRGRTTPR